MMKLSQQQASTTNKAYTKAAGVATSAVDNKNEDENDMEHPTKVSH
jgi:hypothetical protein